MNSNTSSLPQIPPKVDIDQLQSILLDKSPDGYKRLSEFLFSFNFHKMMAGKEEYLTDAYVLERAIAEARMAALEQTSRLAIMTEAAFRYQVYLADRYKWYRFLEAENVVDMLSQILEHEDQRSKIYDLKNWIALVPTLEEMGVSQDELFGVPLYFEKARSSLPLINEILKLDDEELVREKLHEVLKDIVDKNISVAVIREKNHQRMGKVPSGKDTPLANAKVFMLGTTDLILIEAARSQTSTIEYRLKGIVEGFAIRDAASVLSEMQQVVFKSKDRTWIEVEQRNGEFRIVKGEEQEGILVPTPDYLSRSMMDEVAHSLSLIRQMLGEGLSPSLPVYEFQNNVDQAALPGMINRKFKTDGSLADLDNGFQAFYADSLSPELRRMFPKQDLFVHFGWCPHSRVLGLFLNIANKNPEASGFGT